LNGANVKLRKGRKSARHPIGATTKGKYRGPAFQTLIGLAGELYLHFQDGERDQAPLWIKEMENKETVSKSVLKKETMIRLGNIRPWEGKKSKKGGDTNHFLVKKGGRPRRNFPDHRQGQDNGKKYIWGEGG